MVVLEPDSGRLIIAHSDQRELWVKKKKTPRARFRATHAATESPLKRARNKQPGLGQFTQDL